MIRIGYPTLQGGEYDLINFIAIEPVVKGRRGFSELEKGGRDGKQGLWISTTDGAEKESAPLSAGNISSPVPGIEMLTVPLFVEKFANGAHVRLTLMQRTDSPDELTIAVNAQPGSAPIERCILTATMGNKARTRLLWLQDGATSSLNLYRDYRGFDFAEHRFFPLERLPRMSSGDVLVATTSDEDNPASVRDGLSQFWQYRGAKVTQYWRVAAADVTRDLQCTVNARFTYWMSRTRIPGGIAFENFELQQPFRDGQRFTFGVTKRSPDEVLR